MLLICVLTQTPREPVLGVLIDIMTWPSCQQVSSALALHTQKSYVSDNYSIKSYFFYMFDFLN